MDCKRTGKRPDIVRSPEAFSGAISLINELEQKKKTIDLSRKKLENEKEELATIIENQTRVSRTLQNTKKLRESFIAKLSDEEKQLQNMNLF